MGTQYSYLSNHVCGKMALRPRQGALAESYKLIICCMSSWRGDCRLPQYIFMRSLHEAKGVWDTCDSDRSAGKR